MDYNTIDRRQRYGSNRSASNNKSLLIDVKLDITQLDTMCSYIISANKSIHRGHLIHMRNLFSIINMNAYANDIELLKRIDFIQRGLQARLEYNLDDTNMILTHINGGLGSDQYKIDGLRQLNTSEVEWVDKTVSETLKFSIIYNDVDAGIDLLTKFKATPYSERGSIVYEIENWVSGLQVKFRRARAETTEDMEFSLTGDRYIDTMVETYKQLSARSNKLRFGVQALNALTGGGVESQRVYTILGLPGEGKSATLIDMAIQLKRYNPDYVCADPTKRPAIVLLVMENSIKETVQRIFSMCVGDDMLNYNINEIVEILKVQGNMKVSTEDPIDLIVKFKPNLSVDTSYLYTMVEDLEDEGYEVICVLQDYLKRIRSIDGMFGGDLRQQLGAVVNEFKVFATIKNIPVITASQLNREATNSVDQARVKNKSDLVRLIGRGNVGESNLILENSDWIALIAPETDPHTGAKYLGIQRVKSRYYIPNDIYCVYLPYAPGTIKFIEDLQSAVPVHKLSLKQDNQFNPNATPAQGMVGNIKDFEPTLPSDGEYNMFSSSSAILANTIRKDKDGPKALIEMCRIVDKKLDRKTG